MVLCEDVTSGTTAAAAGNLHQLQVFEAGQLLGDGAERVSIQIPGRGKHEVRERSGRGLCTADADSTGGDQFGCLEVNSII